MQTYELVTDAKVSVEIGRTAMKKEPFVTIGVNDKYTHDFDPKSRISKALTVATPEAIQNRLNGGSFFFVENELMDFRDSSYRGFVHDNSAIDSLMEVLGYSSKLSGFGRKLNTQSKNFMLGRTWNEHEITVPAYDDGGVFSSRLAFTWNPFHQNVKSFFELIRLICTNGMVGYTSFLNSNIPLVNRWQDHLNIATMQIQNKVENKVAHRLEEMGNERASVADLSLLANHVHERLNASSMGSDEHTRLKNIFQVVHPMFHLFDHYKPTVFENQNLAAQLPGHLTSFDAWNVATEVSSHTNDAGKSTDAGLQKFANELVFSESNNVQSRSARFESPPVSAFSDPERAFFGEVSIH